METPRVLAHPHSNNTPKKHAESSQEMEAPRVLTHLHSSRGSAAHDVSFSDDEVDAGFALLPTLQLQFSAGSDGGSSKGSESRRRALGLSRSVIDDLAASSAVSHGYAHFLICTLSSRLHTGLGCTLDLVVHLYLEKGLDYLGMIITGAHA